MEGYFNLKMVTCFCLFCFRTLNYLNSLIILSNQFQFTSYKQVYYINS